MNPILVFSVSHCFTFTILDLIMITFPRDLEQTKEKEKKIGHWTHQSRKNRNSTCKKAEPNKAAKRQSQHKTKMWIPKAEQFTERVEVLFIQFGRWRTISHLQQRPEFAATLQKQNDSYNTNRKHGNPNSSGLRDIKTQKNRKLKQTEPKIITK